MAPANEDLPKVRHEAKPDKPPTPGELGRASEAMKPELQAIAQRRLEAMRKAVAGQQDTLNTKRITWKGMFDNAKRLLMKEDSVEVRLVQLNIEIDHLLDKIQNASADQVTQHLWKEVGELEKRCAQLIKIEAELTESPEADVETEEQFPVEMAGTMKPAWNTDPDRKGKLGKFGQDCARSADGIAVVADGMSNGTDSYEMARRVSRRAQAIMEDIPVDLCDSLTEVQVFVNGELDGFLEEINHLPLEANGGTTLLAARYLEKFDAVIMIDIGDCEAVAVIGENVETLKPPLGHDNKPDGIVKGRRVERKDGQMIFSDNYKDEVDRFGKKLKPEDFIINNATTFRRETDRPFVRVFSLAELRERYPDLPIEILLATDGVQNCTSKTLAEAAPEIMEVGLQGIIDRINDDALLEANEVGEVKRHYQQKDDVTLLKMTIPPLAERKQVQVPEEAVA